MSPALPTLRDELAALWRLAWPVLIGQLANVGMGVADVAMTGHRSAAELAAVALGASVWAIALVTVTGVMMAVNSVVAHQVGAGDHAAVPATVRQALWQGLAVGLVAALLANLATLVFGHLQLAPEVERDATRFVHIISSGLPPLAAYRALYGYSTSINQTRPVMLIAVLGLLFNIGANWLLVFGHGGLPALGGVGCAVSTALCMWLMLVAMVLWVRRAPAYRATDPFTHWQWPQWAPQRALLRLGLPIGITYFAEVSAFGVVSLLVARYGAVQVAAHQIALNFSSLTFMLPLSLGIALITRVGQALGQGQPARARRIAWLGVGLALACGLLSALLMVLARAQIAAAYTADPAVQALCAALLLYAALFQLSDAAQVAASSAIRGYQVTRAPMQIQLLAFWGVALPLGCWLGLGRDMAAAGFWIGLTLGLTVAAVLLSWSLARLAHARLAPP